MLIKKKLAREIEKVCVKEKKKKRESTSECVREVGRKNMANIAAQRIKREFKEVIKSEEVSRKFYILIINISIYSSIVC